MQTAIVFLSGNTEEDEKIKQLLNVISQKVSIQYAFYFLERTLMLPHVFYKSIRFSGMIGLKEFISYVASGL